MSSYGLSSALAGAEISGVPCSSYKDTNPTRLGPHPETSFTPNDLFKGPISKNGHIGRRRATQEF